MQQDFGAPACEGRNHASWRTVWEVLPNPLRDICLSLQGRNQIDLKPNGVNWTAFLAISRDVRSSI